jgi:hypothetical protein
MSEDIIGMGDDNAIFWNKFKDALASLGINRDTPMGELSVDQIAAAFGSLVKPFDPNTQYSALDPVTYNNKLWTGQPGVSYIPASPITPDLNTNFWMDATLLDGLKGEVYKTVLTQVTARENYMKNMSEAFAAAGVPLRGPEEPPSEPNTAQLEVILKAMVKPFDPTKNYFVAEHVFYNNSIWQPLISSSYQQIVKASSTPPDSNKDWKKLDTSVLPQHVSDAFTHVVNEMSKQGSNYASNQGSNQGSNKSSNQSSNQSSNYASNQGSNYASNKSSNQGSNYASNQSSSPSMSNQMSNQQSDAQLVNSVRTSFFNDMAQAYIAQGLPPPGPEAPPSDPTPAQIKNIFKTLIKPFNPNKNYYFEEIVSYNNNLWKPVYNREAVRASSLTPDQNTENWSKFDPSQLDPQYSQIVIEILEEMSHATSKSSGTSLKDKMNILQANIAKTTTNAQAVANAVATVGGRRKSKRKSKGKALRKTKHKARGRR